MSVDYLSSFLHQKSLVGNFHLYAEGSEGKT